MFPCATRSLRGTVFLRGYNEISSNNCNDRIYARIDGPFISSSLLSLRVRHLTAPSILQRRRIAGIVIVCPGDTRLSIVRTRLLRDDYIDVYRYLRNIYRPRLPEEISPRSRTRAREWVLTQFTTVREADLGKRIRPALFAHGRGETNGERARNKCHHATASLCPTFKPRTIILHADTICKLNDGSNDEISQNYGHTSPHCFFFSLLSVRNNRNIRNLGSSGVLKERREKVTAGLCVQRQCKRS